MRKKPYFHPAGQIVLCLFLVVVCVLILLTDVSAAGKIVIVDDDWVLSDTGFAPPNDAGTFATNVASWFTGGRPGRFHAYSDHFGLTGSSLASAMTSAGHTWASGTAGFTFDLATLRQYDGIFLLVAPADNNVLIDYVESGGNIYLAYSGDGSGLDRQYNTFVNHFGLGLGVINNGIGGNIPVSNSHPIFIGVDSLYNLNGSDIADLVPTDPQQRILVSQNGHGLYAVYEGDTGLTQPDLAGTWYYEVFGDSTLANQPMWGYGTMTVDAAGTVTGGTARNSFGQTDTLAGGSLTIDGEGFVSGTVHQGNGIIQNFPHGTLDTGKGVLTMVNSTQNSPVVGLFVAQKAGGTFTQTDLVGTWYFQVFADNPSANSPYWGSGSMTVDAAGNVTNGSAINSSGQTKALTGGSLTIDSAGVVSGTVTLSDGSVEYLPHGKLDMGKTILTTVNTDASYRGIFVAQKGGGTFTQQDLGGAWDYEVIWDNPSANTPKWAYGTVMLDAQGAVTGGTATNSDGYTDTLVGGSLTINSLGQVSGTVLQGNGTVESLPYGKLNAGKDFLVMVNSSTSVLRGLFVAQKTGSVAPSNPRLTVTKSGSGTITSSPSGINCGSTCIAPYASGTLVTLTATPVTGSTFASWSGCDSVSGSTCTLTLSANRQVTATFGSSSSASAYFDTVQKLYIGYYQRPADPQGLLFWARGLQAVDTNGDGSFDGENFMWVLEQFANSAESRAIYGGEITSTNIGTVIDWIYMGLFNRHPEPDGLAFWVNSFNTGASTPASILWEVMKGAQNTDRDTLNNKVTASNRFTHVLDPELDGVSPFFAAYPLWAGRWLSNVTWDPATIPTEDAIRGLF